MHGDHKVFFIIKNSEGNVQVNSSGNGWEVTGSPKRISGASFRVLRATQTLGVLIEVDLYLMLMNEGSFKVLSIIKSWHVKFEMV